MKRIVAVFLALIFTVSSTTGCIPNFLKKSTSSLSSDDAKSIAAILDVVEESDGLFDEITELIDKQIQDSSIDQDAPTTGTEIDAAANDAEIREIKTNVERYIGSVEKYQKKISKIKNADTESVTLTLNASQEYFQKLTSCLNDLYSIMTFELDESAAFAPVFTYDLNSYGDDFLAAVKGMYTTIDETIANCQSIETCPTYMQESFNILIEKISIYRKMLDTMYVGYNLNDPLRICSADQLYQRQNIELSNCESELLNLFNLQYKKEADRLSGSIQTLRDELQANCRTLEKPNGGVSEITYSYLTMKPEISIDYEMVDTIYPSLYSSLDAVINLTATSENGDTEVIVQAEIPGFTQEYQQKVTITEQVTKLLIKPVILINGLDLSSSKDAQIRFSITDAMSGKIITEESKTISLMSVYDFALTDDEFGVTSFDNILAWLTPESEGILALRRNAISWLEEQTGGEISSLIGYQDYGISEDYSINTIIQIIAIQAAISKMGVRYNMGAYSLAKGENQRVLLPDDVLSSQSGICIETAILFATAIQSADMHAMILFLPGHAQVAVETWSGSGEYFLVETTQLPFSGTDAENETLITELTNEEWTAYLADPWGDGSGTVYVLDCDLVKTLGIQCINYNNSSANSTNPGIDTTASTITPTSIEPTIQDSSN